MSKKKPSSASLTWKFQGERFQFAFDAWDVDRAKQIIKGKPRPIKELELEPFRKYVGSPGKIRLWGVAIDWKRAQSDDVNLDDPLIMAYDQKGRFPIDGWHRIAKGLLQGRKTLPSVGLTRIENEQVHTYLGNKRRRSR